MNRQVFYSTIRWSLFGGKITPLQFSGMETILDAWEYYGYTDKRWLAYMLATAFHETARTMQAIEEYGKGKGRSYGKPHPKTGKIYYGRGFVQLTHYDNYLKMGKILGIDLVNHPELALNTTIAVDIMFEGMTTGKSFAGDFTGKHLGNYFNSTTNDPYNARRIINITDRAALIAGHHNKFLSALASAC